MRRNVVMPPMGDAAGELSVARWLKSPGDTVVKGETLYEVETEKVTVPVESLYSGTLTEIIVAAGETAADGEPIAVIDDGAG